MIQIFPGKTAVCVSYPYSKEHSCKISEKSCARFSGKTADRPTDQPQIRSLTSTDVENCNVVKTTGSTSETSNNKNIRNIKKSRIRNKKCRKSEMGKSEYQNIIYLQENAISGQSNQPNSMKWLFGSFKNAILCVLNDLS